MTGENEPMALRSEPDQRAAQEWRGGKVEALSAILGQNLCQALHACRFIQ